MRHQTMSLMKVFEVISHDRSRSLCHGVSPSIRPSTSGTSQLSLRNMQIHRDWLLAYCRQYKWSSFLNPGLTGRVMSCQPLKGMNFQGTWYWLNFSDLKMFYLLYIVNNVSIKYKATSWLSTNTRKLGDNQSLPVQSLHLMVASQSLVTFRSA